MAFNIVPDSFYNVNSSLSEDIVGDLIIDAEAVYVYENSAETGYIDIGEKFVAVGFNRISTLAGSKLDFRIMLEVDNEEKDFRKIMLRMEHGGFGDTSYIPQLFIHQSQSYYGTLLELLGEEYGIEIIEQALELKYPYYQAGALYALGKIGTKRHNDRFGNKLPKHQPAYICARPGATPTSSPREWACYAC